MREKLLPPGFVDGEIEISVRPEGISIDATIEGMERLLELLAELKSRAEAKRANEYIHLEDYQILTSNSPPTVVGVFFSVSRGTRSGENLCGDILKNAATSGEKRRSRWRRLLGSLFRGVLRGSGTLKRSPSDANDIP